MLPLAVLAAAIGGWWFAALAVLGGVAAVREWVRLTDKDTYRGEWPFVAFPLAVALALPVISLSFALWAVVWRLGCFAALRLLAGAKHWPAPSATAIGLLVIGLPLVGLVWLRGQPQSG